MSIYVTLLIVSFFSIFLKAFQQQNVIRGNYILVFPTTCALAVFELTLWGSAALVVIEGMSLVKAVLAVGIGGGTGCTLAMFIHRRYIGVNNGKSK